VPLSDLHVPSPFFFALFLHVFQDVNILEQAQFDSTIVYMRMAKTLAMTCCGDEHGIHAVTQAVLNCFTRVAGTFLTAIIWTTVSSHLRRDVKLFLSQAWPTMGGKKMRFIVSASI